MDHRPGALTGFVIVFVALTGSSSVGAWQSRGVSPGFQEADWSGYQLDEWGRDDARYAQSPGLTERHPDYSFPPPREDEQAPLRVQGYRLGVSRRPTHGQASARPAVFNGAPGMRAHNRDPTIRERSFSAPFHSGWEGSLPVLRPRKHSKRHNGGAAFREISATRHCHDGLVFWPDQAEF